MGKVTFCILFIFTLTNFFFLDFMQAKETVNSKKTNEPKVVYPKRTELDFEGAAIEGEMKNSAEFYFQHKPEEKFTSLVKRRKQFHRHMLRDVMLSQ